MNAFTVDLEEWFQGLTSTNPLVNRWDSFESRVVPATRQLLDVLRAHRVQATFFVLGHTADRHPELIETICAAGHEIAVHGYHHCFVWQLTPADFAREVERTIAAVTRITGQRPLGHRAPYFSINATTPWAFSVLESQGLRYDSSIFPTRNPLYGYPGAARFPHQLKGHNLVEFPLSTVRLGGINWPIAGGFYLRTLPYAFIRWGISRLNAQRQPAVIYIHPWEIDCGQRYNQVTRRERITHYHGRRTLEDKLHRLLSDFQFAPLCNLLEIRNWRLEIGPSPISNL